MRVLQINAVYEKFSTGRTTKELHEAMRGVGIESFVASPELASLSENAYKIGNKLDRKMHALCSRISGKQGYFSRQATKNLLKYISSIKPDVIHLRNLHSNYVNIPMLLNYIAQNDIAAVLTLHDSFFYTGKCVYYIEHDCSRWQKNCGRCPALRYGNPSFFLDKTAEMLEEKRHLFGAIRKLAVIGVSQWVTEDAKRSILKNAYTIKCIYNWIDLETFKPQNRAALKEAAGYSGKFLILGTAVSWCLQKGIDIFHNLADILPEDFLIILVGDASQIKEKNPKIKYLGTLNDTLAIRKLYAMADVFVNPTIQETFGKTTAEAMSCGTPVIAYNGTATPELIGTDGSCGFLIDNNTAENYKEKILELKRTGPETMGYNARARAEKLFSPKLNMEEYFSLYYELSKK